MGDTDQQVTRFMASLDALYTTLLQCNLVRAAKEGNKLDPRYVREFCDLLARCAPVTEAEQVVAATFRAIAQKNRSVFIKGMFEGRYACCCLLVDGRMIETGLGVERAFSIDRDDGGSIHIGAPRPPPGQRDEAGRRRNRGRNRKERRQDSAGRADNSAARVGDSVGRANVPHRSAPVLDDASRRHLLDELDRATEEASGDDADVSVDTSADTSADVSVDTSTDIPADPPRVAEKKSSYLDAATRPRPESPAAVVSVDTSADTTSADDVSADTNPAAEFKNKIDSSVSWADVSSDED